MSSFNNIIRVINTFLFVFLFTITIQGQYYQRNDNIPIKSESGWLKFPWAGGLNSCQFSAIDINFDGIKDLFVFDRSSNRITTFINQGTPNTVEYVHAPKYQSAFPKLENFVLLVDYDCDGKEDIFAQTTAGMKVYKNTSDAVNGIQFTLVTSLLKSKYGPNYVNLWISPSDIPAIEDVDNDGDVDILIFGIFGTMVEYHQNQTMELKGNCDSLAFQLMDDCWGQFYENSSSNSVTLGFSCKSTVSNYIPPKMHTGSTLLLLDMDGDNDKELVLGDVSYGNMIMLTNGGDVDNATMVAQDDSFPSYTESIDINIFPAAFYVDINNDNRKDLLVSPNTESGEYDNYKSVWLYKDISTNDTLNFEYHTDNFLQEDMIDVGQGAIPVLFDIDGDSLLDLLIGNHYYFNDSNAVSKIAAFRNTGTVNAPQFEWITWDFAKLSSILPNKGYHPTFGDCDGDGDMDMIVGDDKGKIHYFENTAGVGNPVSYVQMLMVNDSIDVGEFASPQLVDVNRDGLLDLIIGERMGKIRYYENQGTINDADFVLSTTSFGGVNTVEWPYNDGYSSPFLFDENGKYCLYVGSRSGTIYEYTDIDSNINGSFSLVTKSLSPIYEPVNVTISGADIDNDGFMDLFVGNHAGGVTFYQGVIDPIYLYTRIDDNYVADSLGVTCQLIGIVYGINLNASNNGVEFTIRDETDGINVFHPSNDLGYKVKEGDRVIVTGTIDQYNGLIRIVADTISLISSNNTLKVPDIITKINERSESDYIFFPNAYLYEDALWNRGVGDGFFVEYANNDSKITVWIDEDMPFFKQPPITEMVNIIGIGSQNDSTLPYNGNYFLLPTLFEEVINIDVTGISEESIISLYPNPNEGTFAIQCQSEDIGCQMLNVLIYDVLGRMIYKTTITENDSKVINLQPMKNRGIFHVQVIFEGSVWNGKIIIQ